MIGTEYFSVSMRIAALVAPAGVYFLILGLLNSRRHPQLLSGRQDFALLISAISPLFVLPVIQQIGVTVWTIALAAGGVTGIILLLSPRGHTWVVYNLSQAEARRAIAHALRLTGADFTESPTGFSLPAENGFVEVGGFALLRNTSIRLRGGDKSFCERFEQALCETLASSRAEVNPAGVSLLLVATAMLAAPLALVAGQAPEIVRMLTDLF